MYPTVRIILQNRLSFCNGIKPLIGSCIIDDSSFYLQPGWLYVPNFAHLRISDNNADVVYVLLNTAYQRSNNYRGMSDVNSTKRAWGIFFDVKLLERLTPHRLLFNIHRMRLARVRWSRLFEYRTCLRRFTMSFEYFFEQIGPASGIRSIHRPSIG